MIRVALEVCAWMLGGVVVMALLFAVLSQAITTTYFSPTYALVYAALVWVLMKALNRLMR